MSDDIDFYDLLGVDEDASREEIKSAFREQVQEYHPDRNDDPRAPAQFSALKKAYDTLSDTKERDAYDRMGHDEYVANRISGLPSVEDWQVPDNKRTGDDDTHEDTGDRSDDETGDHPTEASDRSNEDRSEPHGADVAETSGSGERRQNVESESVDGSAGSVAGGSQRAASDGVGGTAAEQATSSVDEASSEESPFVSETQSTNQSSSEPEVDFGSTSGQTGAGTARDPADVDMPGAIEDEKEEDNDESDVESGPSIRERVSAGVNGVVRSFFGWPLILAADALFLVSLGLYVVDNAAGVGRFLGALGSAGLDPSALQSAVGTRPEGLESIGAFVVSELTNPVPIAGFVVLVGLTFLPSVYFFMVRWTRKNRLPWQPSYLYVLGAGAPIVGLVLSLAVEPPGLYVELVALVLLPVATIATMLFFGQIKPRIERFLRRVNYRIRG